MALAVSLPFLVINLAVQHDSFNTNVSAANYLYLIFDRFLPSLGAAFCIFGLTDIICVKLIKFYEIAKPEAEKDTELA